jgi:hypothetical protein
VLAGDDVIDFKGGVVGRLGHVAVFTAAVCPLPDKPCKCCIPERCLRDIACVELDAERTAGFGFEDGEHRCCLAEVVHLFLFGR